MEVANISLAVVAYDIYQHAVIPDIGIVVLILRIGDQEIQDFIAFRRQLISLRPGSKLELTVLRDGEQIEINSTLVTPPDR